MNYRTYFSSFTRHYFGKDDNGHTTRRGRPWNPVQVARVLEGSQDR
jgi:hypothetical protein